MMFVGMFNMALWFVTLGAWVTQLFRGYSGTGWFIVGSIVGIVVGYLLAKSDSRNYYARR